MNDTVLLKLKVIVERAVRPVQASLARKKRMREELFAHVVAVFEEELPRCTDEATALIQVEKRFGNSQDISKQLQQSVPKSRRASFLDEQLFRRRAGESFLQVTWRYSMWAFIWQMALLTFLGLENGNVPTHPAFYCMQIAAAGSISGALLAILLLTNAMRQCFFVRGSRNFFRFSLIALATSLVSYIPPLVVNVVFQFILIREFSLIVDWDLMLCWDATVLFASPFVTLMIVIILAWASNESAARMRFAEDWDRLQID